MILSCLHSANTSALELTQTSLGGFSPKLGPHGRGGPSRPRMLKGSIPSIEVEHYCVLVLGQGGAPRRSILARIENLKLIDGLCA